MLSLIKTILGFFHRSQYVSNDAAATIIRNFANGTPRDVGDWDDLETVNHSNPDVALAIQLCWYFAAEFPSRKTTEYCAKEAMPYFKAVADALENGQLHAVNQVGFIAMLKQGHLPDELKRVLNV